MRLCQEEWNALDDICRTEKTNRNTLIGLLEITNGIYTVSGTEWPAEIKYLSAMAMVSFGGISGICQTASMLAKLQSSIRTYVIFKLLNAMLATLFTAALVCYLNHQ